MSTVVAWQYRKVGKLVWDSCGEFTYNYHKDLPEFEVRRLVVLDATEAKATVDSETETLLGK